MLKLNPKLNDHGGIYWFYRVDENGFKFAYIGQSRESAGILTRLCQHLTGYTQHIDLSIRKHKLWSENNPYGWKVGFKNFPDSQLDEMERYYIKKFADAGAQLRNVSLGGQNAGRDMINETKPAKGYRQGVQYGKYALAKQLNDIITKHLHIELRRPDNKVSQKALVKFWGLLDEGSYKEDKQE